MSNILISSPFSGGVTMIPDLFIKHYMLQANGEFVKIYLYLMHISEHHPEFTLGQIADVMNCTENDVRRALKYWEKEGLLTLLPSDSQQLHALVFTMPTVPTASSDFMTVTSLSQDTPDMSAGTTLLADQTEGLSAAKGTYTEAAPTINEPLRHKPLTADRVKQLKENEDIAELLFIAQQYLKKPLSPTETNRILFFYEELAFTPALIEYLIEYCVSKGHKSMNYIEKVAFAWKEQGYTTVQDAKQASESFHKDYYTILKALGIRGRDPIAAEITIMNTWLQEYGFSLDLIIEACTRTILATKQPSLQYTDGILQKWKAANVHTLADIHTLDLVHEQQKNEKISTKTRKNPNRFSNFDQRSYDYESLESQLLNR